MIKVQFFYQDEPGRQARSIGDAFFAESPVVGDVIAVDVIVGGVSETVTGTVRSRQWVPPEEGGVRAAAPYGLRVVLVQE